MPIARRERIALAALGLALVFMTSAPFLYGHALATPELRYTGRHFANQMDLSCYLYLIERARHGHVLFGDPYLGARHAPFQLRPLYTLGGFLGALTGASNETVFEVLRALSVLGFVLVLHAFGRRFLARPGERLGFVLLACLASGLGWIAPAGLESADLALPEATTVATLFESPHFILSLGLFLLVLAWCADAAGETEVPPRRRNTLLAAGATLLLALEHPYDVVTLLAVLFGWLAFRRLAGLVHSRALFDTSRCVFVAGVLGLGAQVLSVLLVPAVARWERENVLPSPPLLAVLAGMGLLLPLAAQGAWEGRGKPGRTALVALAGFLPLALMYSPLRFQRRLIEGAHANLALLATVSLASLAASPRGPRRALAWLLALALLPSTALLLTRDLLAVGAKKTPIFLSRPVEEGLAWLHDHTEEDALVLAEPALANLIPGATGRSVWVGHRLMSPGFVERAQSAHDFFEAESPAPLPEGVDWIVAGSFVEGAGRGAWLEGWPRAKKVFSNEAIRVFRVER